jgi:hypothetical protein
MRSTKAFGVVSGRGYKNRRREFAQPEAGDHDDPHGIVRLESLEDRRDLVFHLRGHRVQLVGSVEPDGRDGPRRSTRIVSDAVAAPP